jgi:hypothetical protein
MGGGGLVGRDALAGRRQRDLKQATSALALGFGQPTDAPTSADQNVSDGS